ncbi:MAG: FMN-binding negative transcriptional regulator, partial [Gammaproteobacteria bacterium]
MARDNEQWKHFQENNEVLVIFMGPHAYISPSIYEGPGVPTWNYAVIHMYGSARIIEDHTSLKGIIEALSDKYEISQNRPAVDRRNIINNLLD